MRAAEASKPRDRAIAVVLPYTGLRLDELAALDLADTRLSARKGIVVVRAGKGDSYREVPLNRAVRAALKSWLELRRRREAGGQAAGKRALLTTARGGRLSPRAIDQKALVQAAQSPDYAAADRFVHRPGQDYAYDALWSVTDLRSSQDQPGE